VKRVALEREVEGVPGDVPGRLQPPGQRELSCLIGIRVGKQAMLNLGGERQRDRALPPLVQVSEPAVGDHHIRQRMRRQGNVRDSVLVRLLTQTQLQHTDGFPAVGHRSKHPPKPGRLSRPSWKFTVTGGPD
jgi:hypothetical protein